MRKILKIVIIIVIVLIIGLILKFLYEDYRIKHAKILVETIENLDIEVYSEIKLSDLIESINGKIIKDRKINTQKIGKKEITFKYINDEKIKVEYSFEINIVDITPPYISNTKNITVNKGSSVNLESRFFCGDNYDRTPKCEVIGEYNINELGDYNLVYKATDSSDNTTENEFTLHVIEPSKNENKSESVSTKTYFKDIVNIHKNENTKIGIDVSKWQGDIDFKKVKEAGVEFVFIKLGGQEKKNGEYYIDRKFEENIKGFTKENIPVGIYFFSYADSTKEAKKQAKWIIKQIKKYKIELPIVFDWENWESFKEYKLSFYELTKMNEVFIKELEKEKYKGMLYSSKYYLENIWYKPERFDIWLAHYTDKTNYNGKYKFWQLCDDGIIDGIKGRVDIDIMYN